MQVQDLISIALSKRKMDRRSIRFALHHRGLVNLRNAKGEILSNDAEIEKDGPVTKMTLTRRGKEYGNAIGRGHK
jgi:hypothetical protein